MKTIIRLTLAMLVGAAVCTTVFAQTVPDSELKKEEAENLIEKLTKETKELRTKLTTSEQDAAQMRSQVEIRGKDVTKCQDDLFALLGASRADYMTYREAVARAESKMRELSSLTDEQLGQRKAEIEPLAADIMKLKESKLGLLPEFYDRVTKLIRDLDALRGHKMGGSKTYVVGTWARDRDCLWNIAKKPDIYADAYAWPKIWNSNRDQVRNPDLIFPKQVLQIP